MRPKKKSSIQQRGVPQKRANGWWLPNRTGNSVYGESVNETTLPNQIKRFDIASKGWRLFRLIGFWRWRSRAFLSFLYLWTWCQRRFLNIWSLETTSSVVKLKNLTIRSRSRRLWPYKCGKANSKFLPPLGDTFCYRFPKRTPHHYWRFR